MSDPTEPTAAQLHCLEGIVTQEVCLCRLKHKATGEWRTILMIVHPTASGDGAVAYAVATMFEDAEVMSASEDYEKPPGVRVQTDAEYEAATAQAATEALLNRVFKKTKH